MYSIALYELFNRYFKMSDKKFAVVIPCYNEANRLDTDAFSSFIFCHPEITFIFVNDGSSDNTEHILRALCIRDNAVCLNLTANSGKAEAVRKGMLHANSTGKFDFIGFWDADLATGLDELVRMCNTIEEKTIYISGCRLLRLGGAIQRKLIRHILGRSFATAVSIHLDLPVYDTQCGAKLYKSECVNNVFARPFVTKWFFDVEILRRLINFYGKARVLSDSIEMPLYHWKDVEGSKLRYLTCLKDFFKLLTSKN